KKIDAARAAWAQSDNSAGTLLKMRPELLGFDKTLRQINTLSPQLLALSEELAAQKLARGASAKEMAAVGRMMMLTQRLARSATEFLTSGVVRPETAFQLGRDTATFRATVDGFVNGSAALGIAATQDADLRAKLAEIKTQFDLYEAAVAAILDNLPKFSAARAAEQSIF
ncbi:MAG: type IV pili methyl-accepting chemotaxis transducer N-terminal domain-containing protein, partial [Gammaproteobacteria bacterium]